MKYFTILCPLLLSFLVNFAQKKHPRVTIWKTDGQPVVKGKLFAFTDSSITVKNHQDSLFTISEREISTIRIKNSFGSNALIMGGIAGAAGTAVGLMSGKEKTNDGTMASVIEDWYSYTPGEGAAAGFVAGMMMGTAVAGLQAAARGKLKFRVNGDPAKWKAVYAKLGGHKNSK